MENVPVQSEPQREIPAQLSRLAAEIESLRSALDHHFSSIRVVIAQEGDTSLAASQSIAPERNPIRTELAGELSSLAGELLKIRLQVESETRRVQL